MLPVGSPPTLRLPEFTRTMEILREDESMPLKEKEWDGASEKRKDPRF